MNTDTHGSNQEEWIGFDLDGTLAKYDGWKGIEHIGAPVTSMVLVAKLLHKLGKKIKILTARVAPRDGNDEGDADASKAKAYVQKWCAKHLGFVPEVTYVKDASMVALFDDRAVAVEQNKGKVLGGWPDSLPKASEKAKKAILKIEKKADGSSDIKFRRGKYDDVKAVFDSMNEQDRKWVAPAHPDIYLDVKPAVRTVAYMQGKPVAFADLFDEAAYIGDKGKRRASVEIAVMEAVRRKGLARRIAVASIAKALKSGKFDDIDWNVVHGNDKSVALAKKLGFRRRGWHWHPQYTISKEDFESEKKAGTERPSDEDLRRMYEIVQADAKLDGRIAGLGFGKGGDAYRKAALKLRIMELAEILKNGKRVRNRIVHAPGYVPPAHVADRTLQEYSKADESLSRYLKGYLRDLDMKERGHERKLLG